VTTSSHTPADLRVGGYRLLAKIGEGGMGVVHLAQGPDGSRVALKVLRPHIVGDDEARERLAREVASLRRVTSPRIAEVLDADPWGETPYVATRYVPGLSLHQHVREEGPIAGADLTHFAGGLAEALIAVHQVGVLHRDIKPSNVLLEGRSPVLIDFGLARLAEDPRLTQAGWLLGTPGYLAPEILYGDDATPASDVHAWAATVVFASTGRPPFGTGPAMAIMDRVRRGEHDLSQVPASVLPLVREGLAPDPGDRPSTGEVVATIRGAAPAADRPRRAVSDVPTMPWVLAAHADQQAAPATKPLTVPAPVGDQALRQPYMQPPPPRDPHRPALLPANAMRQPATGTARTQRGLLLGGLFLAAAVGLGVAPYLTFWTLAVLALAVRTLSWTTESARERQYQRGRHRWYDAPLTVLSSPWYLVVAAGGTVMLLAWAVLLAGLAGLSSALFGLPLQAGLVVIGALLAAGLWTGPGSKRLRLPTRRLVTSLTRDVWIGWTFVGAMAIVLGALLWSLAGGEPSWRPQPGPPWRDGTLLGTLTGWL
jgi:predicted Ser/Thr protein kinase